MHKITKTKYNSIEIRFEHFIGNDLGYGKIKKIINFVTLPNQNLLMIHFVTRLHYTIN